MSDSLPRMRVGGRVFSPEGIDQETLGEILTEHSAAKHHAVDRPASDPGPRSAEAERTTVLLLDDDENLRDPLKAALMVHGLKVIEAREWLEADDALRRLPVEVILVNGLLPGGSGIEFVECLRSRDPNIRIMFLSTLFLDLSTTQRLTTDLGVSLVVYKPADATSLASKIAALAAPRPTAAVASSRYDATTLARFADLRRVFATRLPERIAELEAAVRRAKRDPDQLVEAHALAHRLRGAAGSYGQVGVGDAVGHVEDLLAEAQLPNVSTRRFFWEEVENAVRDARLAAEHAGELVNGALDVSDLTPKALLVVDDDPDVLRMIKSTARKLYIRIATAQSGGQALQRARTQRLMGAILDVRLHGEDSFLLARSIRETNGNGEIPIAFASADGRLETRVAAIEAGGSKFIDKPFSERSFGELVQELLRLSQAQQGRVLIVDDDEDARKMYSHHLRSGGFFVDLLSSTDKLVDRLEEMHPDVMLLDVNLPGVSGIDACRALRMSERWDLLPILIVTARTDPDIRLRAFLAGASDVISKPVLPEELLARVGAQEERTRLLRSRADRDFLSGLMLRRAFVEAFERALANCSRDRKPLSLVLLDIDHFKEVNDTYGHLAGDQVIAQLGELLRRRFRVEDLRARWGGEEFMLVFPGEGVDFAAEAARRLLLEFADLRFSADDNNRFGVTFTAGVAGYPDDGTSIPALTRRADERLYAGKHNGRNRIAGSAPVQPAGVHRGASGSSEGRAMKVLLVDDEVDVRAIGQVSLEAVGRFETLLAASAAEALMLARTERPDVILLDVMMPGKDGLAALAELQRASDLRSIPVVFMTARVQQREIDHYLGAGAIGVIQKPFNPMTLPGEIKRIMETRGGPRDSSEGPLA